MHGLRGTVMLVRMLELQAVVLHRRWCSAGSCPWELPKLAEELHDSRCLHALAHYSLKMHCKNFPEKKRQNIQPPGFGMAVKTGPRCRGRSGWLLSLPHKPHSGMVGPSCQNEQVGPALLSQA